MHRRSLTTLAMLGVAAAFTSASCSHDKCDIFPCGPIGAAGGGGSGQGGQGAQAGDGGGGAGGDGGGGSIDPGCIPSMLPSGETVPATCGVFVLSGATGTGTKDDPTGDLVTALASVEDNKAVYICGTDTFNGTFSLAGGRSIFGGLACANWGYDAANRPKLLGVPDSPTLVVSGAGATKIEDLLIENPDAVAAGASSIGLIVDATTVDMARCEVASGAGVKGVAGSDFMSSATPGLMGGQGDPGCEDGLQNLGGPGAMSACGAGNGGIAGTGTTDPGSGGTGSAGGPGGTGGPGGVGQGIAGTCTGGSGANGTTGTSGLGGSGVGLISSAGYTPAQAPPDAGAGTGGRGGGGGGGARACNVAGTLGGPGGGGGGSGGCGGMGGRGGGGGGASFALVLLAADVDLVAVALASGQGGAGGDGAVGQAGGAGGPGGAVGAVNGSNPNGAAACGGGPGGEGGRGGGGGGGVGGPSAAIARSAGSVTVDGSSTVLHGGAGTPGTGSTNVGQGGAGTNGDVGVSCDELVFDGSVTGTCVDL